MNVEFAARKGAMGRRIVVSVILILIFLAAGTGVFMLLFSQRVKPRAAENANPRLVVRVERARRVTHPEWLDAYGQATALRESEVQAEVAGIVVHISEDLEAGSLVDGPRLIGGAAPEDSPPGQILVRLDDRDLRRAREDASARREQTTAAVTRARVSLASVGKRLVVARRDFETAEGELRRIEDLLASKTATASERDRQRLETALRERAVLDLEGQEAVAKADLERATADETAAMAREQRAEQDLARTVIRAPYRGRVQARHVELGSRVAPGTKLCRIVDPSRIQVAVALGGSRYGEVIPGAPASLRLREEGTELWSGTVARVSPTVDPADRTFFAFLVIETDDGSPAPVPSGAFVLARIRGRQHEDVIPLPRTAFVGDKLYVAIREATDDAAGGEAAAVVRERTPSVRRWLPDVALVDGGVEPGEEIVVTGLEQLADGSRVRIAPEPSPQQEPDASSSGAPSR